MLPSPVCPLCCSCPVPLNKNPLKGIGYLSGIFFDRQALDSCGNAVQGSTFGRLCHPYCVCPGTLVTLQYWVLVNSWWRLHSGTQWVFSGPWFWASTCRPLGTSVSLSMSVSQDIEDRLALLCLFVVRLYLPYTGFKFWGSSHPPVSDSRLIQLQVYTCHF